MGDTVTGSANRMALFTVLSNQAMAAFTDVCCRHHLINENLQRHRAVSLRQHGFLVLFIDTSSELLNQCVRQEMTGKAI